LVRQRQIDLLTQQKTLIQSVEEKSQRLMSLGVDAEAMRGQPHMAALFEENQAEIKRLSEEVAALRKELAQDRALLASLQRYESQLDAGLPGDARRHIRRGHRPTTRQELRMGRVAEFWAAISIGVMLLFFVWLLTSQQGFVIQGLLLIVALFLVIEAVFRGRLIQLVTRMTVALTLLSALVLVYEFFWQLVIAGVIATGIYILWENMQELWR
jgi:cation transport ATPase